MKSTKTCLYCNAILKSRQYKYCSTEHQHAKTRADRHVKVEKGLITDPPTLRNYLIENKGYKCQSCSLTTWRDIPIALELDHIDGNSQNNMLQNLRLLCPNCHAQTETYKNRNLGNGRASRRERYKTGKTY